MSINELLGPLNGFLIGVALDNVRQASNMEIFDWKRSVFRHAIPLTRRERDSPQSPTPDSSVLLVIRK